MGERQQDVARDLAAIAGRDESLWRVLWSFYQRHEQTDEDMQELKKNQKTIKRDVRWGLIAVAILTVFVSPQTARVLAPIFHLLGI